MCSLVGRDGYLVTANKLSPVYLVRHRPKALDQFKSLQAADGQCFDSFYWGKRPARPNSTAWHKIIEKDLEFKDFTKKCCRVHKESTYF